MQVNKLKHKPQPNPPPHSLRKSPRLSVLNPSSSSSSSSSLALTTSNHHASSPPAFLTPEPLQVQVQYHVPTRTTKPLLLMGSSVRRSPRLMTPTPCGSGSGSGSTKLVLLKLPDGKKNNGFQLHLASSKRKRKGECESEGGVGSKRKTGLTSSSSSAENAVVLVEIKALRCSPSSAMQDNVGSDVGATAVRCSPRSTMADNVGSNNKQLSRPPKSPMAGSVGKSGHDKQLRRSPRSTDNVGSDGEGRVVRRSPRVSAVADNVGEIGRDKQLRRSPPKSPMANNVGNDKPLRRSPRSTLADNVGNNKQLRGSPKSPMAESGGEKELRRSPRSVVTESSPGIIGKENVLQRLRALPSSYVVDGACCGTKCKTPSDETSGLMEGRLRMMEEEEDKVLRRSPRGLPSSVMVDEHELDEEIRLLERRKKRKAEKKREKSKKTISSSCGIKKKKEEVKKKKKWVSGKCFFVGEPVSEEEAMQKWGWRYDLKNRRIKSRSLTANAEEDDAPIQQVKCHYSQAEVSGCIFNLGDCALIRGEGRQKHIGRIKEFFRTMEEEDYFRVQWFYKPEDTIMKEETSFHNKKRIFYSTIQNDNMLDCIISKLLVTQVPTELYSNPSSLPPSDYYYDMEYNLDCSTFRNLPRDDRVKGDELPSLSCSDSVLSLTSSPVVENTSIPDRYEAELSLLDLYAGCGAMSTGLCFGAKMSAVNLVTRWAIDYESAACDSLRLNHSETRVRSEAAEDFLELLKHWKKLCKKFVVEGKEEQSRSVEQEPELAESNSEAHTDSDAASEELEVSSLVDICYESSGGSGKQGLKFKVRWKGYGPDEDTWEPIDGLSNCQDLIQDFVIKGFKNKILPLPGDADVICGGPPCQGISGYNRFRCVDDPLADERNRQLIVFMDIVDYLKPKFVLMENVIDILRFDKGSLGRYALSRLVHMNYQARIGIMAAGCYGLPQFRLRVFFWGALPSEDLPQFPLPTHDVVVRYWPPLEFERNVVAYEEGQPPELEDAVFLGDAISDLPAVTNFETKDEMSYSQPPETEFQKYIRSTDYVMIGPASNAEEPVLYDHRPHQLFEDDYTRVCLIPRKKGANFRDLPGVIVGEDNVVRRDPSVETAFLPSGKPMVPEYAFTFEQGKSKRPFARLWWDETMPTIVTSPNCHSQALLHPEQDRVLTVRECARLQGFPDNYRFCGTVKQRYRQVGNAVAVPVAKALGYALGLASQKLIDNKSFLTLPPKFAYSNCL